MAVKQNVAEYHGTAGYDRAKVEQLVSPQVRTKHDSSWTTLYAVTNSACDLRRVRLHAWCCRTNRH